MKAVRILVIPCRCVPTLVHQIKMFDNNLRVRVSKPKFKLPFNHFFCQICTVCNQGLGQFHIIARGYTCRDCVHHIHVHHIHVHHVLSTNGAMAMQTNIDHD